MYYNDATAEWKKGGEERGENDSIAEAKHELERKQHGQGDELEYLGCFRDHPGPLREFARAGRPQDTVDTEAEEEQEEDSLIESQQPRRQGHHDEDGVHVFRFSLTPNVRKRPGHGAFSDPRCKPSSTIADCVRVKLKCTFDSTRVNCAHSTRSRCAKCSVWR